MDTAAAAFDFLFSPPEKGDGRGEPLNEAPAAAATDQKPAEGDAAGATPPLTPAPRTA